MIGPPQKKPLFDWKEVIAALQEGVIGLTQSRYARWHHTLPKRRFNASDHDVPNPDSVYPPLDIRVCAVLSQTT